MIRPAKISDAEAIRDLVNYYAERERMLHRSLESIYGSLRDFHVCCQDGRLIGCAALSISWGQIGEIRSLAVAPEKQKQGIGRKLVAVAIKEAKALGLKRIFTLTYEPEFFARFGFSVVDKETLPTKVWRDCLHCPKADACDEVAMILEIE
ncbi:MAG: N-acetyltransferase [Planctomycetota bacterium]|nr:N-acetyltransferase [Planctomycetota bacterium]